MVSKTLDQLRQECVLKKLEPQPSKTTKAGKSVFRKKDYVKVLQDHSLKLRHPQGIPAPLQFMLSIESPMLCHRHTDLKEAAQQEIWSGDDWGFEEKVNGVRMFVVFIGGKLHFFSPRDLDRISYFPTEYRCILHQTKLRHVSDLYEAFALDCEVTCVDPMVTMLVGRKGVPANTHAQAVASLLSLRTNESLGLQEGGAFLQFHALDVVMVNCLDTTYLPLKRRRRGLRAIVTRLAEAGMRISRTEMVLGDAMKRAHFNEIIGRGGEGVVAKNLRSPYHAHPSRRPDGWVKIKRAEAGSLTETSLGDTLDGWVSGYQVGEDELISALQVSVRIRRFDGSARDRVVAFLDNLPEDLRIEATARGLEGEPCLAPQFEERVAEIDGRGFSPKTGLLRNARLVRWRDDKYRDLCELDEETLDR